MSASQPKVWSLWIYDRHCSLIFHADWSSLHNRTANASTADVNAAAAAAAGDQAGGAGGSRGAGGFGLNSALPLYEQAKLVYGVVFSLRNIVRKLSPLQQQQQPSTSSQVGGLGLNPAGGANEEKLNSYSTSRYTLSHVQTPTLYTFVMLSDPITLPTKRAPPPPSQQHQYDSGASSSSPALVPGPTSGGIVVGGTGGIPGTGGMSTTGVLQQIVRGPWVDFVARNPGLSALKRADEFEEDSDDDDERPDNGDGDDDDERVREQKERREKRRAAVEKQRTEGIGKSVDSELFRAAVERLLAQNKLNAPRI